MFFTRLLIVFEVEVVVLALPGAPLPLPAPLGVVEFSVILVFAGDGPTLILRLLTFTVVGMLIALLLLVVTELIAFGPDAGVLLVLSWAKLTAVVVVGLLRVVDVFMMLLGAPDSVSVFGGCITDIPEDPVGVVEMIPEGCIRWIWMFPLLFVEAVDTLSLCLTKLAGVVVLLIFTFSLRSLLSSPVVVGRLTSVLNGFVTLILSQSLFSLLATGVVVVAVTPVGGDGTDTVVVAGVVVLTTAVAVATVLATATLFTGAFEIELIRFEACVGAAVFDAWVAVAAMLVLIEEIFI